MAIGSGSNPLVLLLGASTAAGRCFIDRVAGAPGLHVLAISRRPPASSQASITWLQHDFADGPAPAEPGVLVSFGPIELAVRQLQATPGIGRLVAVSTASTVFKSDSPDRRERQAMARIKTSEDRLMQLCGERDVLSSLFKTTMIYGGGRDANVSRLAGLVRRLPLLPVTGCGLRSPVHADDLAALVMKTLALGPVSRGAWLLGGGERLSYPEMLRRIGAAQGRRSRPVRVPAWALRPVLGLAHSLGRLPDVTGAMLARQGEDLVVDDQPAREQLGWNPRPFSP